MLVAYDLHWPAQFQAIAAELRELGDEGWTIEHIGSTAVPGMRAERKACRPFRSTTNRSRKVHGQGKRPAGPKGTTGLKKR